MRYISAILLCFNLSIGAGPKFYEGVYNSSNSPLSWFHDAIRNSPNTLYNATLGNNPTFTSRETRAGPLSCPSVLILISNTAFSCYRLASQYKLDKALMSLRDIGLNQIKWFGIASVITALVLYFNFKQANIKVDLMHLFVSTIAPWLIYSAVVMLFPSVLTWSLFSSTIVRAVIAALITYIEGTGKSGYMNRYFGARCIIGFFYTILSNLISITFKYLTTTYACILYVILAFILNIFYFSIMYAVWERK